MSLGQSLIKVGTEAKVRGETRYGFDMPQEGDLRIACVRAPKAPARIVSIDARAAEALPGVVRVFTARDVPGEHRLGIIAVTQDQEFLAHETVRQPYQCVAFVVAETLEAARAGARAVRVDYDFSPGVYSFEEALAPEAPLVQPEHPGGNLLRENKVRKGDAEAALKDAAVVVEATYTTERLEHCALEVEGGRAWWEDGKVVVKACTQNPHYDQADLARLLGVGTDKVRVVQAETGGGFGGKLDLSLQPFLALAAWHLKRPVSLRYSREESIMATAKRHALWMHFVSGADERGNLTALKATINGDTGAFASYGLAVNQRAAVHATGPYRTPNVDIVARMAYTNNTFNGAMRGFGCPQVALAHEAQIDAIAAELGLDPLEVRKQNALRQGDHTCTGQLLRAGVGLLECLERIEPIYRKWQSEARHTDEYYEGVGVGAMYYGIGNTGASNPSTAQVEWLPSGRVTLFTGAADIGQGSDTALKQIAAARLGLPVERVDVCRGDTERTTNAGATSASRQTYISGNAVLGAAANLEMQLLQGAREMLEERHLEVELKGGMLATADGRQIDPVEVVRHLAKSGARAMGDGRFDPNFTALDPETGQGRPYAAYAYAAQCARVRVDRASAMVKVTDVAAAHDVGRAVNPRAVEGQISGGVVMGVGMALMEEYVQGRTDNLQSYHIPTAADAPNITPLIVEDPEPTGPYGAKGVGEPALIPTAPAIAGAVGRALGRPMRHLPISLERVMEALAAVEGDKHRED